MTVQAESSATPFPEQPSGNIPPAVLEVCGAENVTLVETLSAEMLAWRELTQLSDPFADVTRTAHQSDETVLPDTPFEHSLEEMHRAKRIAYALDANYWEASDIAREQSPVLAQSVTEGATKLATRSLTLEQGLRQVGCEVSEHTAPDVADLDATQATTLHDDMVTLAAQFPAPTEIAQLRTLVGFEIRTRAIDGLSIGTQKRPDLVEQCQQISGDLSVPQDTRIEKVKELASVIREVGYEDEEVQQAHRSPVAILADEQVIKGSPLQFRALQAEGRDMHDAIITYAKAAVAAPAERLTIVLSKLKADNAGLLERGRGELSADLLEELHTQCVEVERYVARHAQAVVTSLQVAQRKPASDVRRELRELREEPLRRAYELQRKRKVQHVGTSSVTQEVAPDQDFRKACADAKKIVDGGDHIKHPQASPLAKALHSVPLGEKGDTRLDRQQKGIVVALLTTGLSPLLAARERIQDSNGSGSDAQVELLRRESPRQFALIRDLDLSGSVMGLKSILDNPYSRNQLLNPIAKSGFNPASQQIESLRQTIDGLARQLTTAEA